MVNTTMVMGVHSAHGFTCRLSPGTQAHRLAAQGSNADLVGIWSLAILPRSVGPQVPLTGVAAVGTEPLVTAVPQPPTHPRLRGSDGLTV